MLVFFLLRLENLLELVVRLPPEVLFIRGVLLSLEVRNMKESSINKYLIRTGPINLGRVE